MERRCIHVTAGGCVRFEQFYSYFRLRGRRCLIYGRRCVARALLARQANAFSYGFAAGPTSETSAITSRHERAKGNERAARSAFLPQEIFQPDRYDLRNRDCHAKGSRPPRGDARFCRYRRNAELGFQFLLNLLPVLAQRFYTGSRRGKPRAGVKY